MDTQRAIEIFSKELSVFHHSTFIPRQPAKKLFLQFSESGQIIRNYYWYISKIYFIILIVMNIRVLSLKGSERLISKAYRKSLVATSIQMKTFIGSSLRMWLGIQDGLPVKLTIFSLHWITTSWRSKEKIWLLVLKPEWYLRGLRGNSYIRSFSRRGRKDEIVLIKSIDLCFIADKMIPKLDDKSQAAWNSIVMDVDSAV